MRHLNRPRGLTLIELVITLAIALLLLAAGLPSFVEYIANARLREAGNLIFTQALFARSEAIKRNTTVRLLSDRQTVRVIDLSDEKNQIVLREQALSDRVSASTTAIDFDGGGGPVPFGNTQRIDVMPAGQTCSSDLRCPAIHVDGAGAIRVCGDGSDDCN